MAPHRELYYGVVWSSVAIESAASSVNVVYCSCHVSNRNGCIVLQVLILVAAALITTVTNKLLYYFALYTNHFERYVLCTSCILSK